jgi:tetratricopeptide (TPR) repeat protein
MSEDHPEPQLLERFMRNEADGEERRRVVRHLLAGCSRCAAVTRRLWSLGEARPESPESPPEKRARPGPEGVSRLAEVLDLPAAERRERIGAEERFHSLALCELLIGASRQAAEPAVAVERAEAAVAVAERLDPVRYGDALVRSLGVRSWSRLGSARRLAGDPRGAEEALKRAEPMLREEEDPLEEAEIQELAAALEADRGRLDEAERRLDRALDLYRMQGEPHLQGRVLVQKGTIRGWLQGEAAARQGIGWLEEGLERLDGEREPALVAFAHHRLASLLAEAGRGEEALPPLRRARRLYDWLGDTPNLARLRHLEGKIEEALGALGKAEAAFLDARRSFLGEGLGVEAAAVLLDLAMLYTREGRAAEVRPLAEDLLPILRTRDLRQGAAAALLFFRRLVETGHASLEVLSEVARYVNGPPSERRPGLW